MKRIIVFVLLAIGTFVEADAQIFTKESRREARELKRMGWKSLTDEPIIQQLASAWDLSAQVDSAGSAVYAFQSSYAEGHSIEAALDLALYYIRIGAINTLSKCYSYTITDTDGKPFSVTVVGVYPVAELSKNPYITQSIVSFSPQI